MVTLQVASLAALSRFCLQRGQSPAVLHGQHTDGDGHGARQDGTAFGCPAEAMKATDIDKASGQATGGIDFLAEDEGHLVDEDVAQHTAAGTRDDAQADGSPGGHTEAQGFLDADDIEERETDTVEEEPGVVLAHQPLAESDDPDEAEETSEEVDGVLEPEGCLADEQVARGATAYGRCRADDEGAEEVEFLGSREACPRDGTCQSAYEFQDNEGPRDAEHVAQLLEKLFDDFHFVFNLNCLWWVL